MAPKTYYRLFNVSVYNNLGVPFFEPEMETELNYTATKLGGECECTNNGVHNHFLVMMNDHAYDDDSTRKGSEYFEDLLLVGYFIANCRDNKKEPIKDFVRYFVEALYGCAPNLPCIKGGEILAIRKFIKMEKENPRRKYFDCVELTTSQSIVLAYIETSFNRL